MTAYWQNKNGSIKEASRWRRPGAWFDADTADAKVRFIEKYLRHVKGELQGQLLKLERWEREIVRGVFGWRRRSDNTRLYRECYIEVPKKNGKSTLGAAIGNVCLLTENEPGAEIYSVAGEREQAAIIFEIAKGMVEQDDKLRKLTERFRRSITYKDRAYHVLSSDADTKEGKNSAFVLFDELHIQTNRELYDNLKTGMAARRQPLMFTFTTAGYDRESLCWEKHDKAIKINTGIADDPYFLGVIFAANADTDDWTRERTWKKANPNYGVSVKPDFLREQCDEAKQSAAFENTFKRKHLNIWTQQESRWMQMDKWDACGVAFGALADEFYGRTCYGGLDLSSTDDLSALVLLFPPERLPLFTLDPQTKLDDISKALAAVNEPIRALAYFWIPEENILSRQVKHRVPYDAWLRDGIIEATPGNIIDYRYIIAALVNAKDNYNLRGVLCDPWGHRYLSNELTDNHGFTVDLDLAKLSHVPYFGLFAQNYNRYTPVVNALSVLVASKLLNHGNNPVLRWHAGNIVMKEGPFGGLSPAKDKKREKIDGISALLFALDLMFSPDLKQQTSSYFSSASI